MAAASEGIEVLERESPQYEHSANRFAENAGKTIKKHMRAVLLNMQAKTG